uniref:Mon2 C-terminal domain-containing protein n=1 Tax=Plectus sambesii TaxID=2011161 RepID=A0A914WPA0_9BILA
MCNVNLYMPQFFEKWTISDFLRRKGPQLSAEESENLWLVLYNCLSELCVDSRPPVRKSACQTLLQTVAAHGAALKPSTWKHMVWKILFPMMDKVRALTGSASTTRSDSGALGASNILIHHSRDTESKQWAETSVQTLAGVVKIFNAQRSVLISLSDFPSAWSTLMGYIEPSAVSDNAEMSLAALKSFQELLHGRTSPQTLDINTRDRASSTAGGAGSHGDDLLPNLPEELWLVAWQTWVRIASALIAPRRQATLESPAPIQSVVTKEPRPAKVLLPGPSHLTTLLHTFPQLFDHVKNRIAVEEVKYAGVLTIIKGIVAVPVSTDQAPFILPTAADVTPTQEAVLDCIKTLYEEMVASNSNLREALPDLYRLLLDLVGYSVRTPPSPFLAGKKDCAQWVMQNSIPFAELSLRTLVEYYSNTAHYAEIVQATVLVDIVKCLSVPMSLKYQCPAQTTWKAATSAFITVIRLGLPIARQQVRHFRALWTELADAFEKFLFTSSKPSTPLSSDERKRHEFVDCQMIDLIRAEILPFINIFPRDFTQRIVELLNKGSINSTDHKDVLDTYLQRTELSRVSFEALLSMSQSEPDLVRCTSPSNSDKPIVHLGTSAINSLISRCRQVMTSYVNDEATSGEMRLPQERVVEMASVLNAVVTLIDGLTKRGAAPVASNAHNDVWLELIELYPTLVDCVPSCKSDRRVEDAVVEALKAYKSLLKRP